jgi:hypothetical protein
MLYSAGGMESDQEFSNRVADRLQKAGLGQVVALTLEAVGPLAPLAAQLTLLVEPLLGGTGHPAQRWARLLDDPSALGDLIARLRQES